jgi:hypothetical protein
LRKGLNIVIRVQGVHHPGGRFTRVGEQACWGASKREHGSAHAANGTCADAFKNDEGDSTTIALAALECTPSHFPQSLVWGHCKARIAVLNGATKSKASSAAVGSASMDG